MKTILNLGCGGDVRQSTLEANIINVDKFVIKPGAVQGDIANLNNIVSQESVDEIIARDVLEHISFRETDKVLTHWSSLLKTGGKIYIRVPDVEKQAALLLDGTWNGDIFSYMVFGGQDYEGNAHYQAFTRQSITEKLAKVNIKITEFKREHENLRSDMTSWNANMIVVGEKQ